VTTTAAFRPPRRSTTLTLRRPFGRLWKLLVGCAHSGALRTCCMLVAWHPDQPSLEPRETEESKRAD
jgi:hypothetical protein